MVSARTLARLSHETQSLCCEKVQAVWRGHVGVPADSSSKAHVTANELSDDFSLWFPSLPAEMSDTVEQRQAISAVLCLNP